jgi:hypothetical protein
VLRRWWGLSNSRFVAAVAARLVRVEVREGPQRAASNSRGATAARLQGVKFINFNNFLQFQ